nr:hypothetical protein [Gammaproteobacteria bacterium]
MLGTWGVTKAAATNTLISAGYLGVGAVGLMYAITDEKGDRIVAATMVAVAVAGLLAWLAAYKRYRLIFDTPTSQIISAAQGYVEIVGRCEPHGGDSLLGFGPIPGSVWLQYTVQQRRGNHWRHLETRTSDDTFVIADTSGTCILDPDGAEVVNAHRKTWSNGAYRHIAKYLLPGDTLYALGELTALGGARTPINRRSDVSAVLREWKRDYRKLLARFDANRDGSIDLDEWEAIRQAAGQAVDNQHHELRLGPDIHLLRAPQDGRPLLISNQDPDSLARRFRRWSWFHLAVFVAATVSVLTLWLQ